MNNHEELKKKLAACIVACQNCSDACLDETDMLPKMVECIRLDRDCAEMCQTTLNFISRNSNYAAEMISMCEKLCKACGDECGKHEAQHCKDCAKACKECEEACKAA